MQTQFGMQKVMIPEDKHLSEGDEKEAKCPIFMTKEF